MDNRTQAEIIRQTIILFEEKITTEKIIEILWKFYPKKSKENIKMTVTRSIEMIKSLAIAADQAGGGWNSMNEFCKKSIFDLISILAPNQIRFVYVGYNKQLKDKGICDFDSYECHKKIKEVAKFVNDMIAEFEEHLKADNKNIIAACSKDIYEEIKKLLEN